MSLRWKEVEEEIVDALNADSFETQGKDYKYLLKWGNRFVRQIAQEIDIREHFQTCTRTFTTSDTSVVLPDIFFKFSQRFTKVRVSGSNDEEYIDIVGLDTLLSYDPDRNETTEGNPDAVSIEGGRLYSYPLFAGTLILENYFREPTAMTDRTGTVDLPYDETLHDLLVAGVCRKCYVWLQDFDMANYFRGEIYGVPAEAKTGLLDLYRVHIDKSYSAVMHEAKYY
jgi:hypothetical protein